MRYKKLVRKNERRRGEGVRGAQESLYSGKSCESHTGGKAPSSSWENEAERDRQIPFIRPAQVFSKQQHILNYAVEDAADFQEKDTMRSCNSSRCSCILHYNAGPGDPRERLQSGLHTATRWHHHVRVRVPVFKPLWQRQ